MDGYPNFVREKACGLGRLVSKVSCADGIEGVWGRLMGPMG